MSAPRWRCLGLALVLLGLAACGEDGPAKRREETQVRIDLGKGVSFDMVRIPAGEFTMGSPEAEEGRNSDEVLHRVRITKPYWLATTEVTQAVWAAVMEANPASNKGPTLPVTNVSWDDCQGFVRRLNEKVEGGGFRLPTEAEWEYACRAGSTTRFCFGDDKQTLAEYAWYGANSEMSVHGVGLLKPNAWGPFDMHGNAWEWCSDWDGDYVYVANGVLPDPTGPGSGSDRVFRGGGWLYPARWLRSAFRYGNVPGFRDGDLGFRVARTVAADDSPAAPGQAAGPSTGGQDLGGAVVLRFALDLEGARRSKQIPPGENDHVVVGQLLHNLEVRLERYGLTHPRMVITDDNRIEIRVPPDVDSERIKSLVTATYDLQFRIEVLPVYGEFEGLHGEPRARSRVWEGTDGFEATPEGFIQFKEKEVQRWRRQHDLGEPYVPSDARYRVVPHEGTDRSKPEAFAVLEEPSDPRQRMGGDILTKVRPGPDNNQGPGVHFDVKEEFQNVFAQWTGANVGLPMAIVLNGEFHSAPIINSPLKDSVVITLGGGQVFGAGAESRRKEQRKEQRQMVAVLSSGALRVPLRFEKQKRVGAGR